MAAITSTVLAIGGMAYKGFSAIDAAKSQSREAGRLTDQAEELERQALADLEQNRLEAVQVPLQIFDTTNELQTLDGSTILEAAAEGDQRGVQATAGKIKATQDAARTEARDTIAKVQLDLDTQTAKEGNRKGELVSGMKDERAIEMSLEADAMQANADALEMAGTGDLVSAGTSAFSALTPAFGTKAGKVADGLMKDDPTLTKTAANKLAGEMIADGTVPQTGFQKGLASVGGALKNAFSKTKNTTDELFSEENMADLTEKAKQAGVSLKEFIANLLKKK
tara:strand:+ start:1093 stop:1935 length:843 start_codon:yes stop_codon:yes gene_type:complete